MADGRIVIDVSIDTEQYVKDLDVLKQTAGRQGKAIGNAIADGTQAGAEKAAKAGEKIADSVQAGADKAAKAGEKIADGVESGVEKAKDEVKEIGPAGVQAGKRAGEGLKNNIGAGAASAESKLGGLKSALLKIGSVISIAAIGKKLFDFGKQAVEIGSNVAEVQNVVDTAFGEMSYKIESFAESSIEQFGMSKLAAKQTASTYMSMAKGMGLAEDAASDMSIKLAGLSGDIASFYNIDQSEAATKLNSVFTGETETLKSLGVVMTQTNLDAYAMANGVGKTTVKMTQAELVALRYQYVTEQLGLAQGDFAKTSSSWANQTRILSERWNEFLSIMGQGLIQALTPALQMLNEIMSEMIAFANGFSALMSSLFGTTEAQVSEQKAQTKAINASAAAENKLADATKEAAEAAKKQSVSFDEMNILSSNASGTNSVVNTGAGALSPLTVSTAVIPPSTEGVSGSVSKIKALFQGLQNYLETIFAPSFASWGSAFESLREPASEAFSGIGESVSNLWENTLKPAGAYLLDTWIPDITNSFSENFAPIFSDVLGASFGECEKDFEFLCQAIDKYVADIWKPGMELMKKVSTDMMKSIGDMWKRTGGELIDNLTRLKEGFRETWNNIYDRIIKPVVTRIQEVVSWLWDKHLKKLWDNVVDFFASVGNCIMTVWNNFLSPLVNYIIAVLAPIVTSVINTIIDVVGTVIAVISDVVGGIIKALRGMLDFITGIFSGNFKKAWDGIKTYYEGIWDAIWGVVKGVINLIIDALNALWRGLYSSIAGAINGVGSIVKTFGQLLGQNWGFSVPSQPPLIPKLAQGAVIPSNKSFLAVLGDQRNGRNLEAPEGLIREIVREESSAGGPITINLRLGNQKFRSVVIESLKDLARQNGSIDFSFG